MNRRIFIYLFSGTAILRPWNVGAQTKPARIGYLAATSPKETPELLDAFRDGLRERKYVEGNNIVIEYRWAEQPTEALAVELIQMNVEVIVAWGSHAVAAAKRATSTIPIVMVGIADPVGAGFVATLSRPGGNISGTTNLARDLGGKLLELLIEAVPDINRVFVLSNPGNPSWTFQYREIEVAVSALGLQHDLVDVRGREELPVVFSRMARERAKGVIVLADPLFIDQRNRLAELAIEARLPSVFARRENVEAGGLVSYGPSLHSQFRDTAAYVDKILKGASPAELPVEQPRLLELVINLKTARLLGVTIPRSLLVRADSVID